MSKWGAPVTQDSGNCTECFVFRVVPVICSKGAGHDFAEKSLSVWESSKDEVPVLGYFEGTA